MRFLKYSLKRFLIRVLLISFMVVIARAASGQVIDEQSITTACFDKFVQDTGTLVRDYKHRELEIDKEESLKNHKVSYNEKLYEYMWIKDVNTRRLIESNKTIYDSDKEFSPFSRDFNFDRTFFDRFIYRFKRRYSKNGIDVFVFQFSPKPKLPEDHYFDRVANSLIGELEIRESDNAILTFKAKLPPGSKINYGKPPLGGAVVQSVMILAETMDYEDLTIVGDFKVDINYSTSFLFGVANFKHVRTIKLKDIEKIKESRVSPPPVSSKPSKDDKLLDQMWTIKMMLFYLVILAIIICGVIMLIRKLLKRKK